MNTFWMVFTGTLAAGWGVTAAYGEYRRRRRARRRDRYLDGLRFLLDDKPERALEVFLGLAANDDEIIDTHFALGSLYRRRGEVDRRSASTRTSSTGRASIRVTGTRR